MGWCSDLCRKDVTLLELSQLISSAVPQVAKPNTKLAFRLLFTDSWRPRVILKDVGTVLMSTSQDTAGAGDDAGSRTLEDVKYVIGDWIDVAVFNNNSQGAGPARAYDGPRGPGAYGRGGFERGRGRGMDSYRGGGSGRGRGGRNGYDGYAGGGDRDRDRDRDRDAGDDRGPPRGPRPDRDRGGRW